MTNNLAIQQSALSLEASALEIDESTIIDCPFCRRKNKMSIKRINQGILYNCFSAHCPKRGFLSSMPGSLLGKTDSKRAKFKPKYYNRPLSTLSDTDYRMLYTKYHLSRELLDENHVKLSTERDALVMPLSTYYGQVFGMNIKFFEKGRRPKSICYIEVDVPVISFSYGERLGSTIILVEDQLSAYRCAEFACSAALIGVNLSNDKMKTIMSLGFTDVIIALDRDAISVEQETVQKWRLFVDRIRGASLSADPKDLTPIQLKKELKL
ncbi:MAG: hypothetical protein GY941_12000 [Planctomycetes bacterium]|nr:hypothetical protein [Planctomycetota bacterium]